MAKNGIGTYFIQTGSKEKGGTVRRYVSVEVDLEEIRRSLARTNDHIKPISDGITCL